MRFIDKIYINGQFTTPAGTESFDLFNPSTNDLIGKVILGNEEDTERAITAAKKAFTWYSRSSFADRKEYLRNIHEAIKERHEELVQIMLEEYGGSYQMCEATVTRAENSFLLAIDLLDTYPFERSAGSAKVLMEAVGVVGLITPWNANYGFIASKLSTALAAGCTAVIKPSEMSASQTQILLECLHKAGLPPGLFNVVNGRGDVVGAYITKHPDIAKISFTGSTVVGKTIARGAVDTLKRVTLELGGKSPNVILRGADLKTAIPMSVMAAYMNSGQACIAATRLLVPEDHVDEIKELVRAAVEKVQVGDPKNKSVTVGPMVSKKQYERVQFYIQKGLEEGAEILIGGPGKPEGLERGNFIRPTVFVNVRNDMTIARDEIFGPVLSIITYKTEEEALKIANDTVYGLHGYVFGEQSKAEEFASKIEAGRVFVNGMYDEPRAPFGGFKQSGLGREFGTYGLEGYLEAKAILGHREKK